jgi:hypothetical protein
VAGRLPPASIQVALRLLDGGRAEFCEDTDIMIGVPKFPKRPIVLAAAVCRYACGEALKQD